MATVEHLAVNLEVTGAGAATQALGSVDTALGRIEQSSVKTGAVMGAAFGAVTVAAQALQGALGTLGQAGGAIIDLSSKLQQANIAFTTMLGSGERAGAFLKDLQQFAAQTPFEFPQLVDAAKKMLAFGFAAEQVRPLLTSVGNAAAAMGSGTEGIDRITRALGQMQAKGKVAAEEMLQLTEAGIPAWQMLADVLGTDVAGAMAAVEKRTVDATTMIDAFQKGVATRFGDMMAQQALTFQGAMSTIKDSAQMAAVEGLQPLFAVATDVTVAIAQMAQSGEIDAWAARVKAAAQEAADALRTVPQMAKGAELAAGGAGNLAQATGIPQLAGLAGGAAQAAGVDIGGALMFGIAEGIRLSPVGGVVALNDFREALRTEGARALGEEGKRIGADFVDNVAAAITAQAPQGAEAFGAVAEQLIKEFEGRGFSGEQARQAATLYFDAVLQAVEAKRPDLVEAGQRIGGAVAEGITASQGLVGAAAEDLATVAGAALASASGNVGRAVSEAIRVATEAGFSPGATQALVAETLQQANAAQALTQALQTLTPVERAHWEIMREQQGAAATLNTMYQQGKLTAEQYTGALQRGKLAVEQVGTASQTAATQTRQMATSLTAVAEAATAAAESIGRTSVAAGNLASTPTDFGARPGLGLSAAQQAAIAETGGYGAAPSNAGGRPVFSLGNPYAGLSAASVQRVEEQIRGEQAAGITGSGQEGITRSYQLIAAVRAEEAARSQGTKAQQQNTAATQVNTGMTMAQADALDMAANRVQGFTADFVAGTGAATRSITLFATLNEAKAGDSMAVHKRAMQAQQDWTNATLQATALIKGELAGAWGNIPKGLTYSQIYGGTATSSSTGAGPVTPGTYYGIPVVSPLTPGTLYGHAGGGTVSEPSYLVSMRSGRAWGSIAERGPETVIPHGGGASIAITVYAGMGAGDVLQDQAFWEQAWRRGIQPAAQRLGARV